VVAVGHDHRDIRVRFRAQTSVTCVPFDHRERLAKPVE
jgi:hypothetical protein